MIRIFIFTSIIIAVCFFIFFQSRWLWTANRAKRKGLYPFKGKANLFDVRCLIAEGEKELAIRLYCGIFACSIAEARIAVEQLEKGMQEKKSDLD